jgi:putative endonuclease
MFIVYILRSQLTSEHYTGHTDDIVGRLERHNGKREASTKHGVPWEVVHTETFGTRSEAMRRESEIKSNKGGARFKELINK